MLIFVLGNVSLTSKMPFSSMKSLVFVLSAMLLAACTHPEQVKNPASEGPVIST